MSDFLWTDWRKDLLRTRHGEGVPFQAIADELGTTKNSCISKAGRLRLPRRRQNVAVPDPRQKAERDARARERKRQASSQRRQEQRAVAAAPRASAPIEEEKVSSPVSIADLRPHHCRWPTPWEPPPGEALTYCGRRASEGQTYCPTHRRESEGDWQPRRSKT